MNFHKETTSQLSSIALCMDMIEDLHKIVVRGNGQPGLLVQISELRQDVKVLQISKEKTETLTNSLISDRRKAVWALITAITAGLISLSAILLTKFLK